MSKYARVFLPKSNCYTIGGRGAAQYHFAGMTNEMCDDPKCPDCPEIHQMFKELCEADSKYRQEWMKLMARASRSPQRVPLRAEYHRKRK